MLKGLLGQDPLPDCPACGIDFLEREGFRWDGPMYLLSILGSSGFLLVSSPYRCFVSGTQPSEFPRMDRNGSEKLPGSEGTAMSSISYYDDVSR